MKNFSLGFRYSSDEHLNIVVNTGCFCPIRDACDYTPNAIAPSNNVRETLSKRCSGPVQQIALVAFGFPFELNEVFKLRLIEAET